MVKVTVGFKCDWAVKWELRQEAAQHGLTLSTMLERMMLNRVSAADSKDLDKAWEEMHIRQGDLEAARILAEIDSEEARAKLREYDEILDPIYTQYAGKKLPVPLPDATFEKVVIESRADLLKAIIAALPKRQP